MTYRVTMRSALPWLACLACGSDESDELRLEDFSQSGSRLKLRWLVAENERAVAVEPNATWFHDAELGVDCTPLVWDDGVSYCTPGTVRSTHAQAVYSDAACSQPLIVVKPSMTCVPPAYASVDKGNGISAVMTIGPPTTRTQFYDRAGPDCIGPLQVTPGQFFEPGQVFQRSQLVPVTMGSPRGAGRLRWQYIESADGLVAPGVIDDSELGITCRIDPPFVSNSAATLVCRPTDFRMIDEQLLAHVERAPASAARLSPTQLVSSDSLLLEGGLFDREAGRPCVPVATAGGALHCATWIAGLVRLYEDSACTVPVDLRVQRLDMTSRADVLVTGSCTTIEHVYEPGERFVGQPYEQGDVACMPYQRSNGDMPLRFDFFRAGAELPFDALGPALTLETD